jgi:hypothetical protein
MVGGPLRNRDLLRQQKNPDRLCLRNTLRVLDFFTSPHLIIFERPAFDEFFNNQLGVVNGTRSFEANVQQARAGLRIFAE